MKSARAQADRGKRSEEFTVAIIHIGNGHDGGERPQLIRSSLNLSRVYRRRKGKRFDGGEKSGQQIRCTDGRSIDICSYRAGGRALERRRRHAACLEWRDCREESRSNRAKRN